MRGSNVSAEASHVLVHDSPPPLRERERERESELVFDAI